ncbi:ferric reductase-like transmembrane domain-containing protein [Candidatus Woesearchaeota archaeon]|nr:ferric reductase-like transmembrane domain-containing protein [Candidatus Woesearchaeota archaeon]
MEKRHVGFALLAFLAALPLLVITPFSQGFSSPEAGFLYLGRAFALSGVILFSLNFVLNSRLPFLEDVFGGLDRVLRVHHFVGVVSFALLLLHPLLLAAGFRSLGFLLPGPFWPKNFGIIALSLLALLLLITLFARIRYHNWKFSHQLIGVALFIAAVHVATIPSDISKNIFLRVYIFSIVTLGLVFYVYSTILQRPFHKRLHYSVQGVKSVGRDVYELVFAPKGKSLIHTPGQFVFLTVKSKAIPGESHPFTVSSASNDHLLRFTIKAVGDYTSSIQNLKKGDEAEIEGPYGRFFPKVHGNQIWIAGGIGITPFLSMIRSIKGRESVDLYYSVHNKDDAVFLDELLEFSRKMPNFRVHPHYSGVNGRISARDILDFRERDIFICGPVPMINSFTAQFLSMGVDRSRIYFEKFSLK